MTQELFRNSKNIEITRRPAAFRRFLVFIRCGSDRRPSFFDALPPDARDYDVAVNYFAQPNTLDVFQETAEFVIAGGMSKYQAAKQFLYQGYLDTYDGVYFLDDDIELHFDVSEFLGYCEEKGFSIAQAALTPNSDGAWRITYHHPAFEYRLTNFVEVMAPYISARFLMNVIDSFDLSISTYGLDVLWGSQLEEDQNAAIVDRFQMSHLKRRDFREGAYYAYLRSIGVDCFSEMKSILDGLGMEFYQIRIKGGVEIVETVAVR